QPWMLTLLTVGTHQPYDAPESYRERYADPKMAAVAYLDESITQFLEELKKSGVFEDTLVVVTSDESHGIDELRLASAWGLNLMFAPERDKLPDFKQGVYGHLDLAVSVLDYFGLPAAGIMGRSQFRDYAQGRDMFSYTNGFLRYLHANGRFHECQFQSGCRDSQQNGFISPVEKDSRLSDEGAADRTEVLAARLNQSMSVSAEQQDFLFAKEDKRKLKTKAGNDWTDNLIGAQYLEFASGTRTYVSLRVKALKTDKHGAQLRLLLKEFDQDSDAVAPELPLLRKGESIAIDFTLDNPLGRKAFSFHLLGTGKGEIQIDEFRVVVRKLLEQSAVITDEEGVEIEYPAPERDSNDPV
ncbi:MAG TPA: sulfatase-like hydrolase/transferase, partial [Pseudomonadales bacterium]|nr:sulfatase-like hydrolase/transferase [Pseudomonadales bacterium]